MDWKLLVCILIMIVGLAGTLAPLLPGIPVIFLAMLGYDWANGFSVLGPYFLLVMFLLSAFSILADYFSSVIGAHKYGASRFGTAGALVGGLLGLFLLPLGLILGPLIGAFLGEVLSRRTLKEAARSGLGVLIGLVAGAVSRVVIGVIMITAFLLRVLL